LVSDELSEFREPDGEGSRSDDDAVSRVFRDLLVFEYAGHRYAIPAGCVEGVVPWKSPVAMPQAHARVRGVIQDRGQIVVLMAHPTGRADASEAGQAKRIIICSTPRGKIGLPAFATNTVGSVELMSDPAPFAVHDSKLGPFMYLDPTRYVENE
jgi:chemotaxis signal transduction protein